MIVFAETPKKGPIYLEVSRFLQKFFGVFSQISISALISIWPCVEIFSLQLKISVDISVIALRSLSSFHDLLSWDEISEVYTELSFSNVRSSITRFNVCRVQALRSVALQSSALNSLKPLFIWQTLRSFFFSLSLCWILKLSNEISGSALRSLAQH